MKSIKKILSLFLLGSMLAFPVQASATENYPGSYSPGSTSPTNSNNLTADSGNTANSDNTGYSHNNMNSNNPTYSNSNNSYVNSNNITNSNNTINSNNVTNNINNTTTTSYYMPYNNTMVANGGVINNGLINNNVLLNLNAALDSKLCIGGISILDNFTTVKNNYSQYLVPSNNRNLLFFNGGPGSYGDFLLVVELTEQGTIKRLAFTQFNLINPIFSMNLGNVKPGSDASVLVNEYGKWDDEQVNDNVKQLIYKNLKYKIYPINLTVYVNNYTNQIYGYEISLQ